MKKIKVLFITTLSLLIMVSGTALALTVDNETEVRTGDYVFRHHGDKTYTALVGNSSTAYTAMTNETADTFYMTNSTYEYILNIGWGEYDVSEAYIDPGLQLVTTISRDTSMYGFYQHTAKCYADPHSGQIYDDIFFKAHQPYN